MKKVLLFALVASSSVSAFAVNFDCQGTEPFWSLETTNAVVRYSAPIYSAAGNDQILNESYTITARAAARGMTEEGAVLISTRNTFAAIMGGACNDGMSDESYSHSVIFKRGNEVLAGCCNIKK